MNIKEKTAVALGYFDSVHIGHKAVIETAVNSAFAPAVFTFVSKNGKNGETPLLEAEKKADLLASLGVKYCFMPDFSDIKNMSGRTFFEDIIVKKMNASAIVCGEDFRFGNNAECSVSDLKVFAADFNVNLTVIPLIKVDGKKVSSTEIKRLIKEKRNSSAEALLGRKI